MVTVIIIADEVVNAIESEMQSIVELEQYLDYGVSKCMPGDSTFLEATETVWDFVFTVGIIQLTEEFEFPTKTVFANNYCYWFEF